MPKPMPKLTLWDWIRVSIEWIHWRVLMRLHLAPCLYCENKGDGCDCGACGIAGGHGYQWCMNNQGCPVCRRHR